MLFDDGMNPVLSIVFAILFAAADTVAAELTRVASEGGVSPEAVRVKRGALVHTRMLAGLDTGAGDHGFGDLAGQLKAIARAHDATLGDVAKLNVYVAAPEPDLVAAVEHGIRETWPEGAGPAVTLVPSPILGGTARIAADAVIVAEADAGAGTGRVTRFERDAAVLPANRDILYVSGRAASGELAEATAGTMAQLFEVLDGLGSTPADVVQVKAFIQPVSEWETVEREIDKSFGALGAPPLIFVEWNSDSRATEIELIAAAPGRAETGETVTWYNPTGDKVSPVFSRVARAHAGEIIYIAGLTGTSAASAEEEVRTLFAALQRVAGAAGSDLRHLAKATYYVSADGPSEALNALRPQYYDPQRPPAASKIAVPSIGAPDRGLLIDMIAAPVKK